MVKTNKLLYMTSETTIVAILATTGQVDAGECVMQQHVATNHSISRMLGNYTFLWISWKTLQFELASCNCLYLWSCKQPTGHFC